LTPLRAAALAAATLLLAPLSSTAPVDVWTKLHRPLHVVHESRRLRAQVTTKHVLVDVAFRVRPPEAILDQLSGVGAQSNNAK